MARNQIRIEASREAVFALLAEPERYADWILGTSETRGANGDWPGEGSSLRYRAGIGPIALSDVTEVVESDPPRRLLVRARMRPFGETAIELELEPEDTGTRLVMTEEPVEGLVEAAHGSVVDAALSARNEHTLERLRALVEGE